MEKEIIYADDELIVISRSNKFKMQFKVIYTILILNSLCVFFGIYPKVFDFKNFFWSILNMKVVMSNIIIYILAFGYYCRMYVIGNTFVKNKFEPSRNHLYILFGVFITMTPLLIDKVEALFVDTKNVNMVTEQVVLDYSKGQVGKKFSAVFPLMIKSDGKTAIIACDLITHESCAYARDPYGGKQYIVKYKTFNHGLLDDTNLILEMKAIDGSVFLDEQFFQQLYNDQKRTIAYFLFSCLIFPLFLFMLLVYFLYIEEKRFIGLKCDLVITSESG